MGMLHSARVAALAVAAFGMSMTANAGDVTLAAGEEVTYAKHISRLIQNRCEECHRAEAIAPFSMQSYRQVKGWSKMIREVIDDGRMPPWHANPEMSRHFKNDRSLTAEEKAMFRTWLDNGMPRGDAADMPEPIDYSGAWKIGEPEMVLELPEEVEISATGVVPYMYFDTPTGFTEDMYIEKAQALAGNQKVVHHIIISWYIPAGERPDYDGPRYGFLVGTAPGDMPLVSPEGHARFVPAGAHLRWQMHYTPTGKTEIDRSKLGFIFAKEKPRAFVETESPSKHDIAIPANAENHKEQVTHTITDDIKIISFMPHMHLRGKSYRYDIIDTDGNEETVLDIPQYDFNWQAQYHLEEPIHVKAGSKLRLTAHYDNSTKNPYNPDPSHKIVWGDQTWEEMMIGWFDFIRDDPSGLGTQVTDGDSDGEGTEADD